jgi:hypothetical protein
MHAQVSEQVFTPEKELFVSYGIQGIYGRVDKDHWFQTTVTHIDPTAKQSRVLNPYVRHEFRCAPNQ